MNRRIVIEWGDDSMKVSYRPPLPQVAGRKTSLEACLRADRAVGRLVKALNNAYQIAGRR